MHISRAPAAELFPIAAGPAVHADEADSALADIAERLKAGTLEALAHDADPGLKSNELTESGDVRRSRVRSNPPEDEGDADVIVRLEELLPIAMRVTGQWGPDPQTVFGDVEVRQNPPEKVRDFTPFFDRLRACAHDVKNLHAVARARYNENMREEMAAIDAEAAARGGAKSKAAAKRRKAALKARKRPWLDVLHGIDMAIDFVLRQEGESDSERSIFDKPPRDGGRPFGMKWGVLAAKGNKKLPFVSYSELPMATCPGAGLCRVPMNHDTRRALRANGGAWCYSFKAFRYPTAFARLFLNTLANYADREFAIMRGGGPSRPSRDGRDAVLKFLEARVAAALRGRGDEDEPLHGRGWMQFVKVMALAKTRRIRRGSATRPAKISFMRLFVDGDVNTEDCIVEWMEVCRQMSHAGSDVRAESSGRPTPVRHIEVYGYSKCWAQFVAVDRMYAERGIRWPDNYTVNLSSGSVYAGSAEGSRSSQIRTQMEGLPISRGYFEAISLERFLKDLESATRDRKLRLPVVTEVPFRFDRTRIEAFARLNGVRSLRDLDDLYATDWRGLITDPPLLRLRVASEADRDEVLAGRRRGAVVPVEVEVVKEKPRSVERQVRQYAFREYLSRLLRDDHSFGALVRLELARDANYKSEREYLAAMRGRAAKKADDALVKGKAAASFTEKAMMDKALALALHEVLWSYQVGGGCPLVCGNCSDRADITDPDAVHRCASKTTFRGKTIHIGLH